MPHVASKLALRAKVGDVEFRDVIRFSSTFAVNTIPNAVISVAVGRNVETNSKATIHTAIKSIKAHQKVEVFFKSIITDREEALAGLPDGKEIKIFEGTVAGVGWQRGSTSANFVIHLNHWLADLNYSSALSASSHPGNPSDLTYPAIFGELGGASNTDAAGADAKGEPAWLPIVDKKLVNEANMDDLWSKILHKWLLSVASADPFELNLLGGQAGESDQGDENTISALKKMGANPDGAPLELDLGSAVPEVVADGIGEALINETGTSWFNTTIWGKLIGEMAPNYWFSVIPRVTDALIVPFSGGLQGEAWKTISAGEYVNADIQSALPQVLRAVGILHPATYITGVFMSRAAIPVDLSGCGGWFQPDTIKKGLVLLKDCPSWLSDPLNLPTYSSCSQGIAGDNDQEGPISTTMDDDGDVGKPCVETDELRENMKKQRTLLDNFAHQWYVIEMLKGRNGTITSRLRFDIAPGSNVKIQIAGATNVAGDGLTEDLYATVMQVGTVIDSEAAQAGTMFALAHCRTASENTQEGTSVDRPPMYKKKWVGAKLVASADV